MTKTGEGLQPEQEIESFFERHQGGSYTRFGRNPSMVGRSLEVETDTLCINRILDATPKEHFPRSLDSKYLKRRQQNAVHEVEGLHCLAFD